MQTGTKKTPDRFQNYFCPAAANDIVHHAYAWIVKEPNMQPKFLYCRAIDDPANDRGWNIIAEVWERDVLGGWGISHGLDADVIKKSGDLFATARAMLLDACVCLLYRQGGDSMSMQGLVDLLQNDISHNEDQDMPSIKAAYDKIEADGATVEEDLGLKRYRMFQAIAYGETAISVELDLYAKLSAMADRPLVG